MSGYSKERVLSDLHNALDKVQNPERPTATHHCQNLLESMARLLCYMHNSKFVGADSIFGSSHRGDLGSVAGISEVYAVAIFGVEVFYTMHATCMFPHIKLPNPKLLYK
jgi:hypothetical protein